MQKITPHLWFDKNAGNAVDLYTGAFADSRVVSRATLVETPSGRVESVAVALAGQEFMCLFAGPEFRFTPAISLLVSCETEQEVQELWRSLSEDGKALMPLASYPFSALFGWTEDRYGLSWQVMFTDGRQIQQKIIPTLMFTGVNAGKCAEAISFYSSLFPDSGVELIDRYGAGEAPEIEGTLRHARFRLAGQYFAAMDSARAHGFAFNEAISLLLTCDTQEEIDRYWSQLSAHPQAEQCGWLKDKYGLSWQIAPTVMRRMMAEGSPEQIARVTRAFLPMKKFDVTALQRAYEGGKSSS